MMCGGEENREEEVDLRIRASSVMEMEKTRPDIVFLGSPRLVLFAMF